MLEQLLEQWTGEDVHAMVSVMAVKIQFSLL